MFYKMADILTPCIIGEAEVGILDYTKRGIGFHESLSGLSAEKYAFLKVNGNLVMSETPMEHRTNSDFVAHAHGDILIGGLGLGMIILPIQDKEEVTSITVIEKSIDVIAAVSKQLPLNSKVRIICADAFDWKPDRKFDCVYMDIWGDICEDNYDDMKKLKRKYGHSLKPISESPNRFNWCWAEYYAKTGARLI